MSKCRHEAWEHLPSGRRICVDCRASLSSVQPVTPDRREEMAKELATALDLHDRCWSNFGQEHQRSSVLALIDQHLTARYEAGRREGWQEAIQSVRGSLIAYPNSGGDTEIMREGERICRKGAEAAEWTEVEKRLVMARWQPDIQAALFEIRRLGEELAALKSDLRRERRAQPRRDLIQQAEQEKARADRLREAAVTLRDSLLLCPEQYRAASPDERAAWDLLGLAQPEAAPNHNRAMESSDDD